MDVDRKEGYWRFNQRTLKMEKLSWIEENYKFIVMLIMLLLLSIMSFVNNKSKIIKVPPEIITVTNTIIIPDSSCTVERVVYDDLVNAMIHVESRGRDSVVNKTSGATGCLQLLPIMVREVNQILERTDNEERFTLEDRVSRDRSIAMFHIWRIYHHSGDSYEVISRCWNGGPNGYLIPATVGYWYNVKKQIPGWEKCLI